MVKLYVTVLFLGMQFFTVVRGDIIVLKDIDKKMLNFLEMFGKGTSR